MPRSQQLLTLGLVLTTFGVALEALSILPVAPLVAADLPGGMDLYGLLFAAFFFGSAVAIVIAGSGALGGIGRTWPTALAAFFVGLVSYTVAGRLRVPPLVVVVPAIVPMLPGLSIYRGLSLLTEGDTQTSDGLLAIITAASVAIALASGVILGEYVAQPLKREAHRLENRLAGPRLVGPLRTRPSRRSRRRTDDAGA